MVRLRTGRIICNVHGVSIFHVKLSCVPIININNSHYAFLHILIMRYSFFFFYFSPMLPKVLPQPEVEPGFPHLSKVGHRTISATEAEEAEEE